jgi:hypothetical protein
VSKLLDIVNLLNTSLDGLLVSEHQRLALESGVYRRHLTVGSLPRMEFMHVTYVPGARSSQEGTFMRHAGQEFGYLLSGRLLMEVGFDASELASGDSRTSIPQGWQPSLPSGSGPSQDTRPPP